MDYKLYTKYFSDKIHPLGDIPENRSSLFMAYCYALYLGNQ